MLKYHLLSYSIHYELHHCMLYKRDIRDKRSIHVWYMNDHLHRRNVQYASVIHYFYHVDNEAYIRYPDLGVDFLKSGHVFSLWWSSIAIPDFILLFPVWPHLLQILKQFSPFLAGTADWLYMRARDLDQNQRFMIKIADFSKFVFSALYISMKHRSVV